MEDVIQDLVTALAEAERAASRLPADWDKQPAAAEHLWKALTHLEAIRRHLFAHVDQRLRGPR